MSAPSSRRLLQEVVVVVVSHSSTLHSSRSRAGLVVGRRRSGGVLVRFSSSFFNYTSGRATRKRRRKQLKEERRLKYLEQRAMLDVADRPSKITRMQQQQAKDTRTIRDILFPNPFPPDEEDETERKSVTFSQRREALRLAWKDYRESWEGFWTSRGMFVEAPSKHEEDASSGQAENARSEEGQDSLTSVSKNIQRNKRFVEKGARQMTKEIREKTGVNSMEDLKQIAAQVMKLANECLASFMEGYRAGKKEEFDVNILKKYFEDFKDKVLEEQSAPKKRKPKRRVVRRQHH